MNITADDIRRVRTRIQDPEQWTCGAWARDGDGDELDGGKDNGAVCWCLLGAAEAEGICKQIETYDYDENPSYIDFANVLGFHRPVSLAEWQDHATHEQVLCRLDETIGRLEKAA